MSMTTSESLLNPPTVYVWVWLAGAVEPVVAGRLDDRGPVATFTYGRSYLDNPDAVPLYLPDLPLVPGETPPASGVLPGCIADSAPDAWGRRVIEHRNRFADRDLSELGYLLNSGSDRAGALDFQASPAHYVPRVAEQSSLAELAEAAASIEEGRALPPALERALLGGTSMGGARPKATLVEGSRHMIAKFSSAADSFPVVKAEFVAMELARRAGIDAAPVTLSSAAGRDVLVVDRFDRMPDGGRRLTVSALTVLNLHAADGIAGRYGTYVDLADQIRARFVSADATLRELFSRIVFNILVSNTDDHPKNHAAFWDGEMLTLTPAYDICPQLRTGGEAFQAMAYGPGGERISQVDACVEHAAHYHLDRHDAAGIVERHTDTILSQWNDVCDVAQLTTPERDQLWQRQFLNPASTSPA